MGQPDTGAITFDMAARQAHVLGDGPRIEPLDDQDMDDDTRQLVTAIRASAGAAPAAEVPEYMRIMVKHPEIFRCQMIMGKALFQGRIEPRQRELAVLRCGWLCRAPYEWGEHARIGKRYGLTDEEVERVTRGSSAPGWSEHDAAILRGVEELIADQAMSDATWEVLAQSWDEPQLLEFPMMVGQYVATAFVQNSLRCRLFGDNTGLAMR